MSVIRRKLGDLRGKHGGNRLGIRRVVHAQHGAHSAEAGRLLCDARAVGRENDDVDRGAGDRRGAGHALGRARIQLAAQVLGNNQYGAHQTNPLFLRAATSSPTSLTMMPFCR